MPLLARTAAGQKTGVSLQRDKVYFGSFVIKLKNNCKCLSRAETQIAQNQKRPLRTQSKERIRRIKTFFAGKRKDKQELGL